MTDKTVTDEYLELVHGAVRRLGPYFFGGLEDRGTVMLILVDVIALSFYKRFWQIPISQIEVQPINSIVDDHVCTP